MCVGPLVQRILVWWPADQPRQALALDATTLKKFIQWMGEMTRVSPEIVAEVISTLKEERNAFLPLVAKSSWSHILSATGCYPSELLLPKETATSDGNRYASQAFLYHRTARSTENKVVLHFSCAT
jgi:hypothetical protein